MTNDQILNRYRGLLDQQGARSLFAVESGSRAWGFESSTSDYDVRFVYWMPRDWYLSVEKRRDVIEEIGDDDLDFAGWNIQKALSLAFKSNPSLHDWLATDLVYHQDRYFPEFKALCLEYFQPFACIQHFRSFATNNFNDYREANQMPFKKYFYVFRALLCEKYIDAHQAPAPCRFADLLEIYYPSGSIRDELDQLLVLKKSGTETAITPINPILHRELTRLISQPLPTRPPAQSRSTDKLDDFFRRLIAE